jgi:bifunctional DNA-binding transcriptional regulator/antitoxin component of YhaV-PrlF toxin-antitoxin module
MSIKNKMTKVYTVELEGENGDILPLPNELCESLGWNVGDTLDFQIEGESIILKKVLPKKVHPSVR